MPRVLLLCEYASLNGGERSLLALVERGDGGEFEFIAAAPPEGSLATAFLARGISVEPFGEDASVGGLAEEAAAPAAKPSQAIRRERLAELLTRIRPDVLHANSLSMSRLSGPVAEETETASIGHLRDIVRVSRRAMDDINRHGRILAVSQATREFHVQAGLAAEKSHVLFNGVDLDVFRPAPATGYLHDELVAPRSASLIGCIGQLGMRKGIDVLLDAARRVVERVDAHFVLVGRRHSAKQEAIEYERRLRRMAAAKPLSGRVHFVGERQDVPQLMREFAVLAHAARQEPLGRVLLEACASGTPVVATEAGGTREIFPDPAMARIVPVDDSRLLADALIDVLSNEMLRRSLASAARRRAEATFDAGWAARQLFEHYASAAR
ncbi:MAG: glycosyltransferase [Pirellulaceae bacterium]